MKDYHGLTQKEWREVWSKAHNVVNKTIVEGEKYFDHNGKKYRVTDRHGYAYQIWQMTDVEWVEIGAPVAYNPV